MMPRLDPEKYRLVVRAAAGGVLLVGIYLLIRLFVRLLDGSLTTGGLPGAEGSWIKTAWVLALRLPVPLHVISVGLILQKRWLPPGAARAAWCSVVISGCWLGLSLAVRMFLLQHE